MQDTIGEATYWELVWKPRYKHTSISSPKTWINQIGEDTRYQFEDIKTDMGHHNETVNYTLSYYRVEKPWCWLCGEDFSSEHFQSGFHFYQWVSHVILLSFSITSLSFILVIWWRILSTPIAIGWLKSCEEETNANAPCWSAAPDEQITSGRKY